MATVADVIVAAEKGAKPAKAAGGPSPGVFRTWARVQAINSSRHAAALRPFRTDEFGRGAEAPTPGHIESANQLIDAMRHVLLKRSLSVREAAAGAAAEPSATSAARLLVAKDVTHNQVRALEKVWDFYFELFGQRQSRYGPWLLSCDRIALDCYQSFFVNLGKAKPIPAPPPFSYMRTGFSPSTFRRGIPLAKLGKQMNQFPLVQLPYHRLVNPWTLGAVLHEVSHNLQNELGLAQAVPRTIAARLLKAGLGRDIAIVWARWNRETLADLFGLLLGGPAVVSSLMDVVGRSPESVAQFNAEGVHPTPYLRTLVSLVLLRRLGFADEAAAFERAWRGMYPSPQTGSIPRRMLDTAPQAMNEVVEAICFVPYASLGNKAVAQVVRFERKHQEIVEECAGRLARGKDPGVVPERFLICAARLALERKLARPGVITNNFYQELSRR